MAHENSCPVRYSLMPIDQDIGHYEKGNLWTDQDIDNAAEHMKKVIVDYEYRRMLSKKCHSNYSG
jgi:hypothetical protein